MKRVFLILAIAALAVPATALGKGPSAASIDAPGGGITFNGHGEAGARQLDSLTQQTGFFHASFALESSPMLAGRPKGHLGPKYTITWTVPTGGGVADTIRQDVYLYADPAPVTYMRPGQKMFARQTSGGWFQATSQLKEILVSAGPPASAPVAASGGTSFPTHLVALLGFGLMLAATTVFVVRRRARPSAA